MFTWTIHAKLYKMGINNAHELATGAGLSYPVAVRIWSDTPVARVDAETVRKLAAFVGAKKNPLSVVKLAD